jgi:hypothetical protein
MTDEPGSADPELDRLIRALKADGDASELAGRDEALRMFRDPRHAAVSHRHWRFSARASVVAAVIGFCALFTVAGYASVLPPPIQHITQSVLARFGVGHQDRSPKAAPRRQAPIPVASTISPAVRSACPCPTISPTPADSLVLSARSTLVLAAGDDVLTGQLTRDGHPDARVRVRLIELVAGQADWRTAATGVTDRSGVVTLTVRDLTRDVAFRLIAPDNTSSGTVTVTAVPGIVIAATGNGLVMVSVPFGDPGDLVTLQVLSGGRWHDLGVRDLGSTLRASFTLRADTSVVDEYRVVLAASAAHGPGASSPLRLHAAP